MPRAAKAIVSARQGAGTARMWAPVLEKPADSKLFQKLRTTIQWHPNCL